MAHLDITILGQQYKIGCPEGEQENLLKTVHQLDEHLKEMKGPSRTLRNEQLVVMAALNYRHQLDALKAENRAQTDKLNKRIEQLQEAIAGALGKEIEKEE
ncbi:cell division protein ZapA [Psychromonas sp. RZ22]|uniref:cell division protein ZapA n=1 Tax=Psychromonas algarum TaxID=2555643 RepID=UPI001067852E|nr:cell division protein ZapA [Psychromonas sp. RZ22]TEW53764.1 cell division protein ZapA [Psychromonas sp. RZ22]